MMGSGASPAGLGNSSPVLGTSRFASGGGVDGDRGCRGRGVGGGLSPSRGTVMIPLQGVKEEEDEDEAMVPVAAHNALSDGLLGSGSGGCLINPPLMPPTVTQQPTCPRAESPATMTTTLMAQSLAGRKGAAFLSDSLGLGRTGSPIPSWGFLDVSPQCLDSLKVGYRRLFSVSASTSSLTTLYF